MYKILKAEYSYMRYGSISTLFMLAGLAAFYLMNDYVLLNRITFMIGLMLVAQLIGKRNKEHRALMEIRLPVTIKTLAITRLVIIIIPIIALYILATVINLYLFGFKIGWNDSIFELISMSLITILFAFVYFFLTDIFSLYVTKLERKFYNIVISTIIFMVALLTIITTKNSYDFSLSAGISINILLLAGIIFFAIVTILTFKQKESHIS